MTTTVLVTELQLFSLYSIEENRKSDNGSDLTSSDPVLSSEWNIEKYTIDY